MVASARLSEPSAALLLTASAAAGLGFVAGLLAARRSGGAAAASRPQAEAEAEASRDEVAASCTLVPRRGLVEKASRRRDDLCECGVLFPRHCTPEERQRHRNSNRHRANILKLGNACQVVVTEEIGEYRAAATKLVRPEDNVLEVGSHVGGTTKVLAGLCRKLVGVDQQADLVAQARAKLPNVQFEIMDAFDTPRVLALARSLTPAKKFHKVFIDISGSRDITTVVRLMDMYDNALKPDVIVIKSQAMKRMLLRSQLWIDDPRSSEGRSRRKPQQQQQQQQQPPPPELPPP